METTHQELAALQAQLDSLKAGIREIAHEINNPLGIIRMASYFLESSKGDDEEKRVHYFKVITESIDKIEKNLKVLRSLRENPSLGSTLAAHEEAKVK